MQKKVKMDIPQNQKINLDKISSEENDELERYTIQIQKIKEQNTISNTKSNTSSIKNPKSKLTVGIISVLVFSIIVVTITHSIVKDLKPKEPIEKEQIKLTNNIIGSWQSSNNGLFVFNQDNSFYWYNSYEELNDNYYKGTYNYKIGNEALKEMGFTIDEFKKEYGEDIKLENIYSINLKPNQVLKNKIDITTVELNENENWWYLLIIKENNTANGYNINLDIKYNLIKTAE